MVENNPENHPMNHYSSQPSIKSSEHHPSAIDLKSLYRYSHIKLDKFSQSITNEKINHMMQSTGFLERDYRNISPNDGNHLLLRETISSTLSALTIHRNNIENEKYKKLLEHEERERSSQIIKEDCKSLIKSAGNELKSIKYQLSTLVSNGESHTDIYPDNDTEIEVIQSTLIYAKVFWK